MKTGMRLAIVALLLAAGISSESLGAGVIRIVDDGWYSRQVAGDDELRIHVAIEDGRPTEILLPGFQCPPRAVPDSTDLGEVDARQSIAWLQRYIAPRSNISSDVLAALSAHDSAAAVDVLVDVLESDSSRKNREEALFWLAQAESEAAYAALDHLLR